jgi:hypothetical protein
MKAELKEGMEGPPSGDSSLPYPGMNGYMPKQPPNNAVARGLERFFKGERGLAKVTFMQST